MFSAVLIDTTERAVMLSRAELNKGIEETDMVIISHHIGFYQKGI